MLTQARPLGSPRTRGATSIGALVFLAVAVVVGTPVTGLLSSGNADDFVDPSAESRSTSARLERAVERTLSPAILVLVRTDGPVARRARAPQAAARSSPSCAPIAPSRASTRCSAAAGRPPRRAAAARARSISRDRRATYVAVYLRTGTETPAGERIAEALSDIPGVVVGGYAVAVPQVSERVEEDLARAEMLAFPLLFLLSLLVFRGAIASLLPLFVGLLTIMGTFLGLRIVNEAVLLSIFALNLTIGLGLGLAIDYSLFVLSRYREEMERLGPRGGGPHAHAPDGGPDRDLQLADRRRRDALAARLPRALPVLDGRRRSDHRGRRVPRRARRAAGAAHGARRAGQRARAGAAAPPRGRHGARLLLPAVGHRHAAAGDDRGPDRGRADRRRPAVPAHRVHGCRRERPARGLDGEDRRHGAAHGVPAGAVVAAARRGDRAAHERRRRWRRTRAGSRGRRARRASTRRATSASGHGSCR